MTSPLQYPLINGVKHDFSSIELSIAGQIFVGFKSINYSRTRTRTMVRGNSPDPIAKTRGTNEYTGECEIYLAEWNYLESLLLSQASVQGISTSGNGYGDVMFTVKVTYNDSGFDTIIDVLQTCSIDATDASHSQGTDALVRKVTLNPLKILFNNADDLGTPLVSPPQS